MSRTTILGSLLALCFMSTPNSLAADDLPRIKLEKLVKLDKPIEVKSDPTGRLFLIEQSGRALIWQDNKVVEPAFLDLSKRVYVDFETGLLSIAFHPKFAENGLLYASYNLEKPKLHSVISEFHADPKGASVDLSTERVLLTLDQPYKNHKGGQLHFGPDGMLYTGFGDGGSGGDPHENGQNTGTWLGKILRIDVTPRKGYAVPKDNPFVGREGWKPEIWALGMRNPWRFSFDRETGDLYASDVGQDVWEEVDIITKGGNYGWSAREGRHEFMRRKTASQPLLDPIFEYYRDHKAASITGGYVYRGKKIPALRGWYLFGDYSFGTILGLKYENGHVVANGVIVDPQKQERAAGQKPTQPSAFGEDKDGELYLCDINGWVFRIVAAE